MKNICKIPLVDGTFATIIDTPEKKYFQSPSYKFIFDRTSGFHMRWGLDLTDDGDLKLGMPEIADIEISTVCSMGCKFCYKSNKPTGTYMSLETYKKLISKLPKTICQIALGIGDIDGNPDLWKILEYSRSIGIVPNITINGARMTPEYFDNLAKYCGAVAVSLYDKDLTFNAIHELTERGMTQVNIHYMLSNESIIDAKQLLKDVTNNFRLKNLNAIVFLSLKEKGNAIGRYSRTSQEQFNSLIEEANIYDVGVGFDSCSAFKAIEAYKHSSNYEEIKMAIEPCESSCFSAYISVDGKYYPCSFMEGVADWKEGLNVLECNDFLKDIWWNEKTNIFRKHVIDNRTRCNGCSHYNI